MADIARCGKLATAAQLFFWQRRRYALARSLRDGVNFAPDEPIRLRSIISSKSRRAGIALTGVQSSPRDMCSLLLASRREGRRAGAGPSRRGRRESCDSVLHLYSSPTAVYHRRSRSTDRAPHRLIIIHWDDGGGSSAFSDNPSPSSQSLRAAA